MNAITVGQLQPGEEADYDAFLAKGDTFLPCASRRYGEVLERFLPQSRFLTFVARDENGEIVGSLPCCRMENEQYGPVLNSLPFFGSVGGVQTLRADPQVYRALFETMDEYCQEQGVVSATVIGSPLDQSASLYSSFPGPVAVSKRIAMISSLPEDGDDLEGRLFKQYHESRRRNVRKAAKLGIRVEENTTRGAMEFLEQVHVDNISSIGGLTKPSSFFLALEEGMEEGGDYRIYEAVLDEEPIASLLLLYFNRTVEYFTPALVHEHRPTQALCLLIHKAMFDAARAGYRHWNWGGTWKSQNGLYTFKKKWGAWESSYQYYTKLYPGSEVLRSLSPDDLQKAYPFFFIYPFDQADKGRERNG